MWNYDPKKYDPNVTFTPIPEGKHRLKISEVESVLSKNGKEMIKVVFRVKDYTGRLYTYFVNGDNFQSSIDPFFGSFGIDPTTALDDLDAWIGLQGAGEVEHRDYQGKKQARIKEFIQREEQGAANRPTSAPSRANRSPERAMPDDEYPAPTDADVPF